MTEIKIFSKCKYGLPKYATPGSSGVDLYANTEGPVLIESGRSVIVPTGIFVKIPSLDYELQVRSRSGLSANHGIVVLNSPGTIDSDYVFTEIKVILYNASPIPYSLLPGTRIAQLVLARVEKVQWKEVGEDEMKKEKEETETIRKGGFGHTGIM